MITGINHITLNVVDIDETFAFYTKVLGMKPIMKSKTSAYFLAGEVWIAIVKGTSRNDNRYDHIAFQISESKYHDLCAALKKAGCPEWQNNKSEGDSFYFLDPSGNKFEIHFSTLQNRVREGKANWSGNVEWYI